MREIKFCVIKKEVSPTIPETPLFDLLFPKEGKLSHAKVGAAVGQKAFDFHRPDCGTGSGKGRGAAARAFPCYGHAGDQKGNGSAFWREREVLNGLFLHFYFRTGEAVCPGRGGLLLRMFRRHSRRSRMPRAWWDKFHNRSEGIHARERLCVLLGGTAIISSGNGRSENFRERGCL